MSRWAAALVVCAALAACKKDEPPPPAYTPERVQSVDDAAPPTGPIDAGDPLLGEDKSVAQCVADCVRDSQMRAESPQSIRLRCLDTCEGRCVERCVERNRRRGLPDGGLWDDCAEVCRLQ